MIVLELQYDSVEEFLNRCEKIKIRYNKLGKEYKKLYKFYVYSKRHIKEFYCDLIWLYLNNQDYENIILNENVLREFMYKKQGD